MYNLLRPSLGRRGTLLRPHSSHPSPHRQSGRNKSSVSPGSRSQSHGKNKASPIKRKVDLDSEGPSDIVDVPINLWYHRLGPVTSFFGWFNRTQQKRPLTVQFCTSLTIYFFGDTLAQRIEGGEYDPKRMARNLIVGGISSLPGYKW